MANLRVIKKDVIFLINEVISDCCTYMGLYPERNTDAVAKIIEDAIALGDATFDRINHCPKEGTKKYFKEVNNDFLNKVDSLFTRLSEENKNPSKTPTTETANVDNAKPAKKTAATKTAAKAESPAKEPTAKKQADKKENEAKEKKAPVKKSASKKEVESKVEAPATEATSKETTSKAKKATPKKEE